MLYRPLFMLDMIPYFYRHVKWGNRVVATFLWELLPVHSLNNNQCRSEETRFMRFTLRGARLIDATTEIADSDITIEGEQIQVIGYASDTLPNVIDAPNHLVIQGCYDFHQI